jgi:hypothetical protein
MNLENTSGSTKLKRRSFFAYLSAFVLGMFSLSKLPLNLIKSRLNNELRKGNKPLVRENPYAVKRNSGGAING